MKLYASPIIYTSKAREELGRCIQQNIHKRRNLLEKTKRKCKMEFIPLMKLLVLARRKICSVVIFDYIAVDRYCCCVSYIQRFFSEKFSH